MQWAKKPEPLIQHLLIVISFLQDEAIGGKNRRRDGALLPIQFSIFPGSMQRGCGAPDGTTWRVEAKPLFITTLGESKRKIYPLECSSQYPEWWFTSLRGSWLLTDVVQPRWWAPVFVILQIWSETQAGMREAQKHPQLVPHKGEVHNPRIPPSCPPTSSSYPDKEGLERCLTTSKTPLLYLRWGMDLPVSAVEAGAYFQLWFKKIVSWLFFPCILKERQLLHKPG